MKALLSSIGRWMPLLYTCLGIYGVGARETKSDLRDHLEISSKYIVAKALNSLYQEGE